MTEDKSRTAVLCAKGLCFVCSLAAMATFAGAAQSAGGPMDDYPKTTLAGGGVELVIYLPDAERGLNRGTRFDRSGFVACAAYRGHTWFGPWRDDDDPLRHDNVMGTAGEFGMGTNGMPPPLGFADGAIGDPFIKIGIGILRKKSEKYSCFERCEAIRLGEWQVRTEPAAIEFRQELAGAGVYGYCYTKRIALTKSPGFTITHELQNTGVRPIDQTYYAHNFMSIDQRPAGPDYRLTFPAALTPDRANEALELHGKTLTFRRELQERESFYAQFLEHGLPASANGVLLENRAAGAALRVTGDRPLARYHIWGTRRVICAEPFVTVRAAPGESFNWTDTYELIVNDSKRR